MLPGLRFRKTFSIFPGVRINLSKSGVSTSLGGHGATVNIGKELDPHVTLGVPGSGVSYRAPLGGMLLLILVLAVVAIAVAWVVSPTLVHTALHWWQPRWF
jgi:hypothetical protein